MRILSIPFIILVLVPFTNSAQSTYEFGILPSLNINKKLPKDWSLNFKLESRQSFITDAFNYDYLLTDFSFATAKKIGINTTIAVGYLMRVDDEGIRNRTIQQMNIIKRYSRFSIAHRISTDQTFQKNEGTEFRLRYRISAEMPLNGESLDPKEFFLKFNNEYLNLLQQGEYDLEVRGGAFIGYVITPNNKLELGLDYRINSFITGNSRNRFWLSINFYQSI